MPNSFGVTNLGASLPGDTDPRGIAKLGLDSLPTSATPDPFANVNTIPQNLVNPQTDVYNFGVQRELGKSVVVTADYYYRNMNDMLGIREANIAFQSRSGARQLIGPRPDLAEIVARQGADAA